MRTFEQDVIERLVRIETKLDNDFRALHGTENTPGLLADMEQVKTDLAILKAQRSWWGTALAGWLSVVSWLVTTGIAVVALLRGGK